MAIFFKIDLFLVCVYMNVCHMYLCALCICLVFTETQKMSSDPLKLEFQMVVSPDVGAEMQIWGPL